LAPARNGSVYHNATLALKWNASGALFHCEATLVDASGHACKWAPMPSDLHEVPGAPDYCAVVLVIPRRIVK
jgi:hypothetical protein